jgi:hypothetical protein
MKSLRRLAHQPKNFIALSPVVWRLSSVKTLFAIQRNRPRYAWCIIRLEVVELITIKMESATALPRRSLILFDHLCVFPRKRLSASEIQLSSLFFFFFFFPIWKVFCWQSNRPKYFSNRTLGPRQSGIRDLWTNYQSLLFAHPSNLMWINSLSKCTLIIRQRSSSGRHPFCLGSIGITESVGKFVEATNPNTSAASSPHQIASESLKNDQAQRICSDCSFCSCAT